MVSMVKLTHRAMRNVYSFVPMQDFSKPWTDEELYGHSLPSPRSMGRIIDSMKSISPCIRLY